MTSPLLSVGIIIIGTVIANIVLPPLALSAIVAVGHLRWRERRTPPLPSPSRHSRGSLRSISLGPTAGSKSPRL